MILFLCVLSSYLIAIQAFFAPKQANKGPHVVNVVVVLSCSSSVTTLKTLIKSCNCDKTNMAENAMLWVFKNILKRRRELLIYKSVHI